MIERSCMNPWRICEVRRSVSATNHNEPSHTTLSFDLVICVVMTQTALALICLGVQQRLLDTGLLLLGWVMLSILYASTRRLRDTIEPALIRELTLGYAVNKQPQHMLFKCYPCFTIRYLLTGFTGFLAPPGWREWMCWDEKRGTTLYATLLKLRGA